MYQINLSMKQTLRHREQDVGNQGEGTDWKFVVNRCKLIYIECINNKVLLYSTGNYIQYAVINLNRKEYEKECIYIRMYN